jgi:hypothetical protein
MGALSPAPTGTADNDILVILLSKDSAAAVTWPTGWTTLSEDTNDSYYQGVGWRRALAADTNWTWTFASTWRDALILGYSGAVTSGDPIDPDPPAAAVHLTNASTITTGSNTTVTADTMRVALANNENISAWGTTPAGWTVRQNAANNETYAIEQAFVGPGSTGTVTITDSPSGPFKAYLLEIASVAAGGGFDPTTTPFVQPQLFAPGVAVVGF